MIYCSCSYDNRSLCSSVSVCTVSEDPYSEMDLLLPWLRHQVVCYDQGKLFVLSGRNKYSGLCTLTFHSALSEYTHTHTYTHHPHTPPTHILHSLIHTTHTHHPYKPPTQVLSSLTHTHRYQGNFVIHPAWVHTGLLHNSPCLFSMYQVPHD